MVELIMPKGVKRPLAFAFAVLLAVVTAGCGSRPDPALRLAASSTGSASSVQLLAATTRRPSDDAGLRFSGERTLTPRFARLTITLPPGRPTGEIIWPKGGAPDPAMSFAATRFDDVAGDAVRPALASAMRESRSGHVLVFVHGYNTRFDEAAFRLAQIVTDSGAPVTPVLFSWPSWGTLASYPYDRESAATSRDGLESVLALLAADPAVKQVSLLAHSMGGWLALESLRQMAIRRGEIPAKITDVMLAAPDVDVDVAASLGQALQAARRRPKITLFVSEDDKALSASRFLWGSRDRLGAIDSAKEPYRSTLRRNGVEVIDLTAESSSDSLNHGKFAASPMVVRLIGQRLANGQTLHGETSAGERAGALTQGTVRAVGNIVTAPLRLGAPQEPAAAAAPD
jgi:esterase/lipase superfamily enzyme